MIESKDFVVGNNDIKVKIDPVNETVKVNNVFFSNLEDYIYFVNKLTDIAEELKEEVEENEV